MTETSQLAHAASVLPSDRFLDRELSWLAFNQRVLELAQDQDMELLERVKYLSIFASNLDEFFMVRVAGLKRRLATGMAKKTISGMLPTEVHSAVLAESYAAMQQASKTFND
jgi:polyphosphate kinase